VHVLYCRSEGAKRERSKTPIPTIVFLVIPHNIVNIVHIATRILQIMPLSLSTCQLPATHHYHLTTHATLHQRDGASPGASPPNPTFSWYLPTISKAQVAMLFPSIRPSHGRASSTKAGVFLIFTQGMFTGFCLTTFIWLGDQWRDAPASDQGLLIHICIGMAVVAFIGALTWPGSPCYIPGLVLWVVEKFAPRRRVSHTHITIPEALPMGIGHEEQPNRKTRRQQERKEKRARK